MTSYQPYNGGYNGGDYNSGDYNSGGFDTNQVGSSQSKTQQKSSLTPVTIKEIIDSKTEVQDGDFVVHNMELNQVCFVAVIRNVIDNTSSLQISLEDGTGSIEVRKWNDENAPETANDIFVPQKYVYVTGSVKEFGGHKSLQHATFREVTDYNEVIYHQLSAINAYFESKGLLSSSATGSAGTKSTQNKEGLFVSDRADGEGSTSASDRVLEFIQENTPSMPEGVPAQLIAQNLGLLVDDVVLHCGKLTEDGRIYAGYDENGYLAI